MKREQKANVKVNYLIPVKPIEKERGGDGGRTSPNAQDRFGSNDVSNNHYRGELG